MCLKKAEMVLTIKPNKCCYFCNVHLPAGTAIPLFTLTKNKEFTGTSCFTADRIVLLDLLRNVRLNINTAKVNVSKPSSCK